MQLYSQATPIVQDMDNTTQPDILKSKYVNIRYGVTPNRYITIDSKYEANLPGLAFDFYGNQELWRVLLAVNGLNDPINDVIIGTVLMLPTQASVDAYLAANNKNLISSMVI
jgi:hypothetical protein